MTHNMFAGYYYDEKMYTVFWDSEHKIQVNCYFSMENLSRPNGCGLIWDGKIR